MLISFCRVALCATGVMWLAVGHAEAQTPDNLTLHEAVRRVAEHNPSLMAYAPRIKALAADRISASLTPPMELSVEADEFAGSNEARGRDSIELTLALSGVIELGERPASRMAMVDAQTGLSAAQQRTQLLDLQAEAARLFVELATLQQELVVARDAESLARETEKTVNLRLQRGRAPQAELRRAQAAIARASLEVGHIEHQLPTLRVKLAALWGQEQPDFERVDDDALFHPGRAGGFEPLVAALAQSPDLQQLVSRERILAANLRLAQSSSRGDLRWKAGVRRLESSNSTGLIAGISIPLFTGRRARGEIDAAAARGEAARFDSQAARIAARATLFEAWQHRVHAIEAFSMLQNDVIPQLASALSDTSDAYRAGRYSYLDLIAARRELIDARLALLNAARRAHLNRIELERLAGAALSAADGDATAKHEEQQHDH
ncbi:MAG: TolC family protein [Oceanococcus sp.]